jgi:hypothetical protein
VRHDKAGKIAVLLKKMMGMIGLIVQAAGFAK